MEPAEFAPLPLRLRESSALIRLLIYSPAFFPSVGGLELMTKLLGEELTALGCLVKVVTRTPDPLATKYPFDVVRAPSPMQLLRLVREADLVLHMNLSLKGLWPFAFVRRPLLIHHGGAYRRTTGRLGIRDRMKYWVSRFATNIACSEAIATDFPAGSTVIRNAYDDCLFRRILGNRPKDLVFVGRLVSEKGAELLLRSLVDLRAEGLAPSLTIVGFGPEEERLRHYCLEMHLQNQVTFAGKLVGAELVDVVNSHRIMVVPSLNEPFGIVALEGIACGCAVVASDSGGLPEAIGECGITFRSGDVSDLTRALKRILTDQNLIRSVLSTRDAQLARFKRSEVAKQYFAVMERATLGTKKN